jgi:hypothetical protein
MPLRFSANQVHHFVLRKQHLAPTSRGKGLVSVVRDIGPLRATPVTTPYLSLWARMCDLSRDDLDAALYRERSLIRIPCLHAQLYIVTTEDASAYLQATQPLLAGGLAEVLALAGQRGDGTATLAADTQAELLLRVLEVLSARGPQTVDELAAVLPELDRRLPVNAAAPALGHFRLGTRLLSAMCATGQLVRAAPQGGWRSEQYRYAAASAWLPNWDSDACPTSDALRQVIADYVRAFGPVTVGDVSHWIGGYSRREIVATLMDLEASLIHIQIADSPGDYIMRRDQVDALAAETCEESQIALLPPRDTLTAAYSDPARFMPAYVSQRIYGASGEAPGTVWLGGTVVGTWGLQWREERFVVRLFDAVDPRVMALIAERAREMAALIEIDDLDLDIGTELDDESLSEDLPASVPVEV